MKRGKVIVILVCVFVLVVAVGFGIYTSQRSRKVLTFSKEKITEAYITNGYDGKITELTGDNLDLIYNDFSDLTINRIKDFESTGWNYSVDFTTNSNSIRITLISDTEWKISGKRYEVPNKIGEKIFEDISRIVKK